MNQQVESIIRSYYQAFNEKRYEDMLALLSETVAHDSNQGSRAEGKAAFRAFLKDMDHFYSEKLEDIIVLTEPSGRRAAAEFICQGTYKVAVEGLPPARGQSYRLPVGCFFELKDGKITRVTNYYNLNDWLSQVKA